MFMMPGQMFPESQFVKPTESLFSAKEIPCEKCFAPVGQQCFETVGSVILHTPGPNHVERARQARWKKMNLAHPDI